MFAAFMVARESKGEAGEGSSAQRAGVDFEHGDDVPELPR